MTTKYKNKYRIESHRMPNWDYSRNGVYFLTFVTQNRECNLGIIHDGVMELSDFGKIVDAQFHLSFEIRNELFLNEYIIMPNHLHTIVVLDNCATDGADNHHCNGCNGRYARPCVSTPSPQFAPSTPENIPIIRNIPIRKPKSISSFVAGFKSAINSKIDDYIDLHQLNIPKYNRYNHFFQPNYHDHIVRNNEEHERIRRYIINNPQKWADDSLQTL